MPLDASIALAARPVQLEDPLNQYAKVAQIKGLLDASQTSALQRQALQNQLSEHDRVLAAFNGLQPGQSVESILPQIYAASPQTGIAVQKNLLEAKQAESTIAKNNAQAMASKIGTYRDMLGPVGDQATYDPWRAGFVKEFPQFAQSLPTTFSPEVKLSLLRKGDELVKSLTPNMQQVKIDDGQKITTQYVDVNPVTNPGIKNLNIVTQKQATPGEKLVDQRTRELNGILAGQTPVDNSPTVKAIANYETPLPPRPSGSRNPLATQRWDAMLAAVKKENPDYNAQDYVSSQKAYTAFTSGQQGNAIRSFSVSMTHLDTLQKLADALQNGDTQLINKWSNAYKEQTGQAAPTNFETAKQIVADEVVKAIVGSGSGALGDRQEAAKNIMAKSSPAQLAGAIGTYKELMAGQLGGLRRQYETSTHRKDFDKFLSEEAKGQLEKHAGGGQQPTAAPPKPGEKPVTIKGDDGYSALPSGTLFVGPDGVPRRKP